MKDKDTQEIKPINDVYLGARIPAKNKAFLESYARKMDRSASAQIGRILEHLENGDIEVIAYELRNIGVTVKSKRQAKK
jgi:hypothetical protein